MATQVIDHVDNTQHEDGDDSSPKTSKALLKASQDQYLKALEGLLTLDRAIIKNAGRPLITPDNKVIDANTIKDLHGKAISQLRGVFSTTRSGTGKGGKGGNGNVGFKKADIFSEKLIAWLNDPRTTFNPPGFQPFTVKFNPDGTQTKIPVPANTPLQQLITIVKNDQVQLGDRQHSLRGVSSSGIMSALFSLYLDQHGLKGVPDPNKLENGVPRIDRRYFKLDDNLMQHFGEYFNGPILVAMNAQNEKAAKKRKPFIASSLSAVGSGMIMTLLSLLKDKTRTGEEALLKHPSILDMINADQELISSAVTYNKQLREGSA